MYTIIGNGRLAQHLCHYFDQLNIPYTQWYRKSSQTLAHSLQTSTHILLLIPDKSIDEFILMHQVEFAGRMLIHCSGSYLSAHAYTAHPLGTFTQELYQLSDYTSTAFIIEKEGPEFKQLLPGLPNAHFAIPRAKKMYYHALCVMANNFTTLLWQKFFTEMQSTLNIPAEAGMQYLQQTLTNLKKDYKTALTGPLVRDDQQTLQNDLNALAEDPFFTVFESFIQAYKRGQHENTRLLAEETK